MNKKYLNLFVIIALVATNAILVFFLMQRGKPRMNPEAPKKMIIERLKFDDNQIDAYQKLIDTHRKDIKARDMQILAIKNELYLLLLHNDIDNTAVDSLSIKIAEKQKEIELIHFNHFRAIKSICVGVQVEHFNALANDLVHIFNHKKH
jgi:protein CpxP